MDFFRQCLIWPMLVSLTAAASPMSGQQSSAALSLVAAVSPSENVDDDDDEDAPVAAPTQSTAPAPAAPAAVAPSAATEAPVQASTETQRLVSGAPLFNPNVAVHTVEKKANSDLRKLELTLYPVAIQVNGKFAQHLGTMASITYHLQENFGIQLSGGWNWYNVESPFNLELVEKFAVQAGAASSLLWTWGVMGGVEVTPFYGKFSLFEGTLAHFSFVINAGAGAGGTRHQVKPKSDASPATYGDTGVRFMGSIGAGFRLELGNRLAFRLEVRDVVYTARVERLNGCNAEDLKAMDDLIRAGQDPLRATVGAQCDTKNFTGTIEGTDIKRVNEIPLAYSLVKSPSSDVLNNVGLYLGVSFLF
jgi:outer membrane beta-barrel protein